MDFCNIYIACTEKLALPWISSEYKITEISDFFAGSPGGDWDRKVQRGAAV